MNKKYCIFKGLTFTSLLTFLLLSAVGSGSGAHAQEQNSDATHREAVNYEQAKALVRAWIFAVRVAHEAEIDPSWLIGLEPSNAPGLVYPDRVWAQGAISLGATTSANGILSGIVGTVLIELGAKMYVGNSLWTVRDMGRSLLGSGALGMGFGFSAAVTGGSVNGGESAPFRSVVPDSLVASFTPKSMICSLQNQSCQDRVKKRAEKIVDDLYEISGFAADDYSLVKEAIETEFQRDFSSRRLTASPGYTPSFDDSNPNLRPFKILANLQRADGTYVLGQVDHTTLTTLVEVAEKQESTSAETGRLTPQVPNDQILFYLGAAFSELLEALKRDQNSDQSLIKKLEAEKNRIETVLLSSPRKTLEDRGTEPARHR